MRALIRLVVMGAIVLGALALVALRPQALSGVLPPAAVATLADWGARLKGSTSGGNGADATVPLADAKPADFLTDSPEGLLATGPIGAGEGNRPVFIDAAVSGYSTRVSADIPAEITTMRPILGCRLTPPQDGSVVGHATSGISGLGLALSTYSDTHLAAAVQDLVDAYRSLGPGADPAEAAIVAVGPAYQAYDVAVTETRSPVYLVLENRSGARIWNLHLAPGVRVERVILLGGDQAGVANLDPVVPVEVILNDGLAACGIAPAYPLNPGHLLMQAAQGRVAGASRQEAEAEVAALTRTAEAYDVWFRDSFGVLAGQSRVGFDAGTLSLIGPVPGSAAGKAVYAPIAGARIRTTQDQFFEIRGQVAEGQDFAARVMDIATGFAFGDLATLRQGVEF